MSDQISIFDIIDEPPVIRLRVVFLTYYGTSQHFLIEVKDKKEINAAVKKCRQEHPELYFSYMEEIK